VRCPIHAITQRVLPPHDLVAVERGRENVGVSIVVDVRGLDVRGLDVEHAVDADDDRSHQPGTTIAGLILPPTDLIRRLSGADEVDVAILVDICRMDGARSREGVVDHARLPSQTGAIVLEPGDDAQVPRSCDDVCVAVAVDVCGGHCAHIGDVADHAFDPDGPRAVEVLPPGDLSDSGGDPYDV